MRTHTDRDVRILVARSSVGVHHVPLKLADANLEMANLPHVELRGANLARAHLRGAMLWGARLDGACLEGADLTCANLTWSSLGGCSMDGTLLVEADLDEAEVDSGLCNAVTAGANMTTTLYLDGPTLDDLLAMSREALDEMNRKYKARRAGEDVVLKAHVENAPPSLRERGVQAWDKLAQLKQAQGRVLSDSDLRDLLRWSAEVCKPLNLRGCNLSGADLRNASLDGACLAFADLTGADTRCASLVGADIQDSYGWA